jgi:hypothetical protein
MNPLVPGFSAMNAALLVLQCLHVFWFTLIVKAVYLQITVGVVEDMREDEDGGEGQTKKLKKKKN